MAGCGRRVYGISVTVWQLPERFRGVAEMNIVSLVGGFDTLVPLDAHGVVQ